MNGLNSSSAISFGKPHWCSFSDGPETITERPVSKLLPRRGRLQGASVPLDTPTTIA